MNLKTKFIIISAGLAAFAQAQDLQSDAAPAETTEVSADAAATGNAEAVPVENSTDATVESTETATEAAANEATEIAPADSAIAENNSSEIAATNVAEPTADSLAASDSSATQENATEVPVAEAPAVADSSAAETVVAEAPKDSSAIAPDTIAAVAPTTEPKAAHPLDILHGNAYNVVGNEAASATIGSDLAMPHKMFGHKLGYFEPVEGYGVASFGQSNTYFLAFDNSLNMGLVTAGFANSKFGAALKVSFGKNWNTVHNDVDNSDKEITTTSPGSLIGAVASTKLGNLDLGVDVEYAHTNIQSMTTETNAKLEVINWDAGGKISVANYSNSRFVWAANLSFLRHQAQNKVETTTYFVGEDDKSYIATHKSTVSDTSSRVEVLPQFNIASTVLESPKARLHIGLNTSIPMVAYDIIEGVVSRHNEYGLQFVPNILGEVTLGKYAMAFGSASYQWDAIETTDVKVGTIGTKNTKTVSGTTTANIGMRVHTDFAALELTFTRQFLQNPFGSFSNTDEIGFSLGAFVLF